MAIFNRERTFKSPKAKKITVYVVDVESLLTLGLPKLAMNNIVAPLQELGLWFVASYGNLVQMYDEFNTIICSL